MPIRWTLPVALCAYAASGQTVAEPASPWMKSRRRIACPLGAGLARRMLRLGDYIRDLRPAEWGFGVSLRGSNPDPLMSALGQKQTYSDVWPMSALPPKADIAESDWHRFVPNS